MTRVASTGGATNYEKLIQKQIFLLKQTWELLVVFFIKTTDLPRATFLMAPGRELDLANVF